MMVQIIHTFEGITSHLEWWVHLSLSLFSQASLPLNSWLSWLFSNAFTNAFKHLKMSFIPLLKLFLATELIMRLQVVPFNLMRLQIFPFNAFFYYNGQFFFNFNLSFYLFYFILISSLDLFQKVCFLLIY